MAPRVLAVSEIGDEEKSPEPLAAATTLADAAAVTGLEDPAISGEALEAAAASRRLVPERGGGLTGTFVVQDEGLFAPDDYLREARVQREWQKIERGLGNLAASDEGVAHLGHPLRQRGAADVLNRERRIRVKIRLRQLLRLLA